jgi:hypothetical protein
MKTLKGKLAALGEGGILLVPGGIQDDTYLYIVERRDSQRYRFSVVNTSPEGGLEYHFASAATPNKLKYHVLFSVNDVTPIKIMDDAFWAFLFKLVVMPDPKFNTPQKLYAWLLPFLSSKSTEHILAESITDKNISFRTPPRSNTGYLRCLVEASAFILKGKGISEDRCSLFFFLLRAQMVEFALHDTRFVPYLRSSDRAVLRIAASQLAYSAVKLGSDSAARQSLTVVATETGTSETSVCMEESTTPLLGADALSNVQDMVEALLLRCDSTKLVDKSETALASPRPLQLHGNTTRNSSMGSALHPFFNRLVRIEDVNGLAGAPVVLPKYVPVDFLQLPLKINTLEDAVAAIRYTDRLCTLISVQTRCIKNVSLLKVSLIQNTFSRLIPVPKSPDATDFDKCIWRTPMRYGLQLDLVICLGNNYGRICDLSLLTHICLLVYLLRPHRRAFHCVCIRNPY